MNLNFLSGFLLAIVALAVLVYLIKEVFGERISGRNKAKGQLAGVFDTLSGGEAKPVNNHLIGTTGKVVEHSDDGSRPMTVDLSPELWPARHDSPDEAQLPIGTAIKVTAVDGPVVVVAVDASRAESPEVSRLPR